MDNKNIVLLKEKNKVIDNLKKEIDGYLSKIDFLSDELKLIDFFYELQNDLIEENNKNFKAYFKIKKLGLFDYDFYIHEYNYTKTLDPLLHYIYIGYKEGKNPNNSFDGEFYSESYPEIKQLNINPLVYFALYGLDEGKILINKNIKHILSINKLELIEEIKKFDKSGLNEEERETRLIISLTSFPERIYDIHFTIYSLLNQTLKPDKVILWLSDEEFPNKEFDLSSELLALKNNGLEIKWCENIKSYKKLIPSIRDYPNDIIITADDDLFYPESWLNDLYSEHLLNPNCIISQRIRLIDFNKKDNSIKKYNKWGLKSSKIPSSFLNFSTNGAGSLFPPGSLHEDISKDYLFEKLCPSGDDIWIWAMAVLNNTKIIGINKMVELTYINVARELNLLNEITLWDSNASNNDVQLKNIFNHYPIILERITDEFISK